MNLFKSKTSNIILIAFALNTLWEFGQCMFFYNMWSWPFWKSTVWMWAASFGDVLIVFGLWKGACFLTGLGQFHKPSRSGYLILLLLSFGASIGLEWVAIYLDLWSYDAFMPVVEVGNRLIGVLPILQITFLPAISVWLAKRERQDKGSTEIESNEIKCRYNGYKKR